MDGQTKKSVFESLTLRALRPKKKWIHRQTDRQSCGEERTHLERGRTEEGKKKNDGGLETREKNIK